VKDDASVDEIYNLGIHTVLSKSFISLFHTTISRLNSKMIDYKLIESKTYSLLCSYLRAIFNFIVTEKRMEEFVETGILYYLVKIAVKVEEACNLRELAVRIMSSVSESIWTRKAVADNLTRVLQEMKIEFLTWLEKFRDSAINVELFRFNEMMLNTELDPGMYCPEPPSQHAFTLEDFPFLSVFEEKFDIIKQEAIKLKEHQDKLIPWPEKFIIEKGWDILGLYAFTNKFDQYCEICPETTKILESIEGSRMQTALFSCLRPRAHIKPHIGYYTYSEKILRVHLGVNIPEGCEILINGHRHQWQEGKVLIFDDTFRHEAYNPSYTDTRVVLMFDILVEVGEEKRNPEFFEKAKKQKEFGEKALISNDLLGVISENCLTSPPKEVKERPVNYL